MSKYSKRYNYYDRYTRFILFIKVDESCNLQCKFCYQGEKEARRLDSKEKFENCFFNIDYVINRFKELKNGFYDRSILTICFFGGEPTLNTKAIHTICEYLLSDKFTDEDRKSLVLTMTTNGVLFNEDVKSALRKMKQVNPRADVSVMISTDNDKEAYDNNRKLVGSDKSAFEIVQNNIKEYNKFFKELNGEHYNKEVVLSTVLASTEQIRKTPDLIQKRYKEIARSGKLIYDIDSMGEEYINEAHKFLMTNFRKMIKDLSLKDKEETIDTIMSAIWTLGGDYSFEECNFVCTIDGNGDMNWCNKVRNFEDKIYSQDELRKLSVFNRDADNTHFRCNKEKHKGGDLVKNKIRPILWNETKLKFDPTVPIQRLSVDDDVEITDNLKDFVCYMMCSTKKGPKSIFWNNIPEDIESILKESDVKINPQHYNKDQNVFRIIKNGDVFFDRSLAKSNSLALTNINQKHFMWIYTPRLIHSINIFFKDRVSRYPSVTE